MAVDKREKKKKKREEKQKARRREAERMVLQEKAEDYDWQARRAFRDEDYQQALAWALKKLKLTPLDESIRRLAIQCANQVGDMPTLLTLLEEMYRQGNLTHKEQYFLLARIALSQENFRVARVVLEDLVSDAASEAPLLQGRFSKAKLKEAQQLLVFCQLREQASAHRAESGSAPPRTGTTKTAPPPRAVETPPEAAPLAVSPSSAEPADTPEPLPQLGIVFETDAAPVLEAVQAHRKADPGELELALKAYRLSFRTSYDQLLCLPTLHDVRSLWYQEETARKVMKTFRGRAILADEVGLGKTVEAGLIVKEYLMRGLVHSTLILAPSSLVHQWQEELSGKFAIPFVSTNDTLFKQDPERFWKEPFILASIQTAKSKRHFDAVTARSYDMVVVDEAHHLKNRTTLNWKLVNAIQKTFLLMLTATPVQNSLEELYNLVTLLRPGHLKTQKAFKEQFVTRGNPTDPRNREMLRQLLKEVMVRNTRSVTQLHLPPRFALTVRVTPTDAEEAFYRAISGFVADRSAARGGSPVSKLALKRLLAAAGSSHAAALRMLDKMGDGNGRELDRQVRELLALGRQIHLSGKVQRMMDLLRASKDQKIVFVNTLGTLEYLRQVLQEQKIRHAVYYGGMNAAQKKEAIDTFRDGLPVLLATGTGGEGHNLQFCHVMLNFDLPWNPMEIEQRIGRIHRIGQERDVQVYNFCAAGTVEDRILEILDKKINMFELVVGEIDMILGRLQGEEEFGDLVYEIWVNHPDEAERRKAFDALAARIKRARSAYEKSKELDEKLFQEDFGV